MSSNFFFNNFQSSMEQRLVDDLVTESIKIHGIDLYYLPKRVVSRDTIFREEELVTFNTVYPIEMYIRSVDGFEGEGDFLSKFGVEIRDQITFAVSRRSFGEEISTQEAEILRPREGDLIWLPLNDKVYKIMFTEHEPVFYQLGSLQFYELNCELFEYNNETFETGIPNIDSVYGALAARNEIGNTAPEDFVLDIPGSMNEVFEFDGKQILDFSEMDPFSEGDSY
jgi:hypothetical protein